MTIVYKSECRKDYLYLVGEGIEEGLEENKQIHQMIVNLSKEHNCPRVLIDDKKVIYTASIVPIYYLADQYTIVDIPRYIKRAALVANARYEETNVCFENTIRNRGINLRLFSNAEEAEAWLLKE